MGKYSIILFLMLWSCKNSEKSREDTIQKEQNLPQYGTLVFNCEDGYQFTLRMEGQEAWIYTKDTTIKLEHANTVSGIQYSNEETVFRSNGNEAQLEIGDSTYHSCHTKNLSELNTNRSTSGATFVAMGSEPNWHLEIHDSERIELTTDFGQKRYVFNDIDKSVDKKKKTIFYKARQGEHYLSVQILDSFCSDDMSGENFSKTVKLLFDQKAYQGCGAMFH